MLHYPMPVNVEIRPVEIQLPRLPAASAKRRVGHKTKLALLGGAIRNGEIPTQRTLADALGVCVAMISAAENLNAADTAAVEAGNRPLIPRGRPVLSLPAPADLAEAPAAQPTDSDLVSLVRRVGPERIWAAIEAVLN
jgi:hypothetical protein